MLWLQILILAVIQGVGEFLPISSSGHLVVGIALFEQFDRKISEPLTVNVLLHVGTLLAILVFYRRRIVRLLGRDRRMIPLLIVGTIPAVVVGLAVEMGPIADTLKTYLESALVAGWMFPVTGLILLWSARHEPGEGTCRELTYRSALLIGVAQAFAVLPGISRSGATIVTGLRVGLRRDEAATFSFLLAIPVIVAAGAYKSLLLLREPTETTSLGVLAVGLLVSFVVGLAALRWLIRWLDQGKLHWFAWWVIPLGVAVLAWQMSSGV